MKYRKSIIYIVGTVKIRTTGFELRMTQPKTLAPNQFAFALDMSIDEDQWLNRQPIRVSLGNLVPPERMPIAGQAPSDIVIGDSVPERVLKRMTGK
jgi:hypothetical protein